MYCKRILFPVVFILSFSSVKSQVVLEKLDRGTYGVIAKLYADTVDGMIYAGGQSPVGIPLYTWDGNQWDSIKNVYGSYIRAIADFNDELCIGGAYDDGSLDCWGFSTFDSNSIWQDFPVTTDNDCGAIWDFCIHNNELYAVGIFDSIAGIAANKIARFDGTNWFPLPYLDSLPNWGITTITFYKGELYVGGNFVATCGPNMSDIAKFDGTQWVPVGNGLSGSGTIVNRLYVYDSLLIVSGYFQTSNGDPGNNIVAWDGTNWIQLGDGLMPSNVHDVIEYNGNLYACGQISSLPDGTPIDRMAIWDGNQWNNAGLDFRISTGQQGTPITFAKMNDELYIGGGFLTVNGDTVNNIIKYKILTGVEENTKTENLIYPNPATHQLTINGAINCNMKLFSISGQLVYDGFINTDSFVLDIQSFTKGMYILEVYSENVSLKQKLVIE